MHLTTLDELLPAAKPLHGNLLKGPWAGPKPHAAASLRPPGSHLVRVAGWHLELPVGGQGRDEDFTASGRPAMGGVKSEHSRRL